MSIESKSKTVNVSILSADQHIESSFSDGTMQKMLPEESRLSKRLNDNN
jgi:hypothetical protein